MIDENIADGKEDHRNRKVIKYSIFHVLISPLPHFFPPPGVCPSYRAALEVTVCIPERSSRAGPWDSLGLGGGSRGPALITKEMR